MSQYLDFAEIKASNPIEDVVLRLGLNLTKSQNSLRGKCPVCEATGERNLVITPSKSVFFCFSDGKGGDCIALVSHVKGLSAKDAAAWIAGATTSTHRSKEKAKEDKPSEGFKPLEYLIHAHESVEALGFDPADAERLGIGYAPRGVMKGLVCIPVRLANGNLAGYVAGTDFKLPPKWQYGGG